LRCNETLRKVDNIDPVMMCTNQMVQSLVCSIPSSVTPSRDKNTNQARGRVC